MPTYVQVTVHPLTRVECDALGCGTWASYYVMREKVTLGCFCRTCARKKVAALKVLDRIVAGERRAHLDFAWR